MAVLKENHDALGLRASSAFIALAAAWVSIGCGPQPVIVEAGGRAPDQVASSEPNIKTTNAPLMVAGAAPKRVPAPGPLDCGARERLTIGGRAYCINRSELSFAEAEDACIDMRGHLATISDRAEEEALRARFAPAWRQHQLSVWIGLVEPFREGDWRWVTGEAAAFQGWGSGEPNDVGGEDCAEWRTSDGAWNDLNCFTTRPYLCQSPVAAPGKGGSARPKGAAQSQLACSGDGQRLVAGSMDLCAHSSFLTFQNAQEECRRAGGHLAVIRSEEENRELVKALGSSIGPVSAIWLGLSDEEQEGRFAWTSGEPLGFTSWNAGEPNNVGEEDCGTWITTSGNWNDVPCSARLWSLCEGAPASE